MKMNIELKFRAFHKPSKQMFEVFSFCKDFVKVVVENEFPLCQMVEKYPRSEFEPIMQFTGLEDDENSEIYHKDVCLIKFNINDVEDYIYNSLTKKERSIGEKIFVVDSPIFNNQPELNAAYIKVIGNVYENPELLANG